MRSLSQEIGLLVLVLLLAGAGKSAAAEAELKKVHVLLVFDTSDEDLASSLTIDKWRLQYFLSGNIPEDRYSLTILQDKDVTPERILAYYRDLKLNPANEGLLFFYGGHGATDPINGHYFRLTCGKNLLRSELRKAMEKRQAALTVILSDCCSTPAALARFREKRSNKFPQAKELRPTVRCLLFESRGTVDVTAATNNASWSDDMKGGLFTRAVCIMLTKPVKSLDTDGNGKVTWQEFFPQLQRETEFVFRSWTREVLKTRGVEIKETSQKPQFFALGKTTAAVVVIENGATRKLVYQWRWQGKGDWKEVRLAPGKQMIHAREVSADPEMLPTLQMRVMGRTKTLEATKWQGEGKPSVDEDHTYVVRLGKK